MYAMRAGNTRPKALEDTVPVTRARCIASHSLLMRAPVKWERTECALLLSTRDVRKLECPLHNQSEFRIQRIVAYAARLEYLCKRGTAPVQRSGRSGSRSASWRASRPTN